MTSVRTLTLSHLVITAQNVPRMTSFFASIFGISPRFQNNEFADFALPGGARIAFFAPLGKSAAYFKSTGTREAIAAGITVSDVDQFYQRCQDYSSEFRLSFSGPPKDHPWGERSFLLIDTEKNRWEITQSPGESGLLIERTP